jgi:two-component system chemotaxis response regulator CheB
MADRDIIVIGGSAGATAPLKAILARLLPDLPAAVFVVMHLPAQGIGILSTVASAAGKLPVRQADGGSANIQPTRRRIPRLCDMIRRVMLESLGPPPPRPQEP